MNLLEIFLTALSLSMDAFMVSICKGLIHRSKKEFIMIIVFSLFQALMPIIGFYLGNILSERIINYSPILSSFLLITIGIIIYKEKNESINDNLTYPEIILLGIATSIDALVIGISFSFLKNNIYLSSMIIGIITFIMCIIGLYTGHILNKKISLYSNKIGGIILIIIGLKTLIKF